MASAPMFWAIVLAAKMLSIARCMVGSPRSESPSATRADEAFAQIPEADLQALLTDKEKLTQVLLYHVVSGEVPASAVMGISSAETVQGSTVAVKITAAGKVMVNDATFVATDVEASNGIIHVIDKVILPPM